jgi:phosphatidylglycerol:prolipoprotein diacylglycerol transferase
MRDDLGLYDALVLTGITVIVFALDRRGLLQGRLLAVVAALYGGCRFALDFLCARDLPYSDARYLGLTPAQYGALFLLAWGAWTIWRPRRESGAAP